VNTEVWRRQYLDELRTSVNLTAEQLQKVNVIMDETDSSFNQMHERHHQDVEKIKEDYRAKLRALLTPDQLPKYEQFRTERDAKVKTSKR